MCPKPTFTQANVDNILDNSAETNKQKEYGALNQYADPTCPPA